MKYINQENKIFIAGHRGMVGSAISRNLKNNGYINLLTAKRSELDLTETSSVKKWYEINNPDVVVIAAAKVGGIFANSNFFDLGGDSMASLRLVNAAQKEAIAINVREVFEFSTLNEITFLSKQSKRDKYSLKLTGTFTFLSSMKKFRNII